MESLVVDLHDDLATHFQKSAVKIDTFPPLFGINIIKFIKTTWCKL